MSLQIQEDALETYTHLPLYLDPTTKLLSTPSKSSTSSTLADLVANINATHALLKSLDTPQNAPPPPLPVAPKRSAQITKMRESGVSSMRAGKPADALRLFSLAIDMAASRPPWEPAGLLREELAQCYLDRANAHVLMQSWPEGWVDAQCSIECKRGPQVGPQGQRGPGNPGGWAVGGKCLSEMGRWGEAREWLEKGVGVEGDDGSPASKEMHRLFEAVKEELRRRDGQLGS